MIAVKHFRTCLISLFIIISFYSTNYAQVGIVTKDSNTTLFVNGASSLKEAPDPVTQMHPILIIIVTASCIGLLSSILESIYNHREAKRLGDE